MLVFETLLRSSYSRESIVREASIRCPMIDYLPSTDPAWNMLFFGRPYRTIGQFSQYRATVEQLPAAEQVKVDYAAEHIINSFLNPVMTGGTVMAIGCRGHADQDLQKTGKARSDFEQQISEERANKVVAEARNAREGLELFHATRPRLVTLDLMMPDAPEYMPFDLFRQIRRESPQFTRAQRREA